MKFIDSKLYIEFKELVECGVSELYLKKAKSTGVKCWSFMDDPDDRRKVLVDYEELKDTYKKLIIDRYSNPYDMVARMPILNMVELDAKANQYYRSYKYNDTMHLPLDRVDKYTREASWLGMLQKVSEDPKIVKRQLGLKMPMFYNHVAHLINIEKANGKNEAYTGLHKVNADFPSSYQRLLNKVKKYSEEGYDSLIDHMFGNKRAAKVGMTADGFDEDCYTQQMALIRTAARLHVGLDSAAVTKIVNKEFEELGWNTVSRGTVYKLMKANEDYLTPGRKGTRAHRSQMAMQVKRTRPSYPTYYWTLDGWTVELLYQETADSGSKQGQTVYHKRLVMVVVLDAMNNYPVGYAIGERENTGLIREACRNAILHMRELFGDSYYPYQIQSDHYQIKNLTPFYQAMNELYTPASVGNAKAKVIEPYFNYLNKTYCKLCPNWAGHNLDSTNKNQPNRDFQNMIKKHFPDRDGVVQQINHMMNSERAAKMAEYMDKWTLMPEDDKKVLTDMDWLMVFGQEIGGLMSLTSVGIRKQINKQNYYYDTFDPLFRENRHIGWKLLFDPEDMSRCLATSPDGKLRLILEEKVQVPMSLKEQEEVHVQYRTKVHQYNKGRERQITKGYAEEAEIVVELTEGRGFLPGADAEAMLKTGFTVNGQQKELLQNAKQLGDGRQKPKVKEQSLDESWKDEQQAYLNSKVDLDEYE